MARVIQALTRALTLMLSPRVWLLIWKPALFSALVWLLVILAAFIPFAFVPIEMFLQKELRRTARDIRQAV